MPRITEGDVMVSENNEKKPAQKELLPAWVSEIGEWSPELVIMVVCLAFAGALDSPHLAWGAALAALRIITARAHRTWSNARVRRQYDADRAAARARATAEAAQGAQNRVEVIALPAGGETR